MARCYNYAIAQLEANPSRGERLNVGLLVFDPDGLRVHYAKNLEKVRAISAAIDRAMVEQALTNLVGLDCGLVADGLQSVCERVNALSQLSAVSISAPGRFFADSATSYEISIDRLMAQLIEPEPSFKRGKPVKKTRLMSSVKAAFRAEKILAKKDEGLDSHRIVLNEQLADGLNADLVLKNGSMHVTQTVDASHIDRVRRAIQEIGLSSLIFEQARINFGGDRTVPRLVYSASAQMEASISAALHAAEHQGAKLINWDSRDDRTGFVVEMSSLAEPSSIQQKANFGRIHASSQDRFKIN